MNRSIRSAPPIIALPDGFEPEGIAIEGTTMYVGSPLTGDIYKVDLHTGKADYLVQPQNGWKALGLAFGPRKNYLYAAGDTTGKAFVYDTATRKPLHVYQLTTAQPRLINDVTITDDAAYFTDSYRDVLYRLPLLPGVGLPDPSGVEEIQLEGFENLPSKDSGKDVYNANGIVSTPDGKALLIVHTDLGKLYRVDPTSGLSTEIDLGVDIMGSDGLVLIGHTLYIVNSHNKVIVVQLNPELTSGKFREEITDSALDCPSTAAQFENSLYVVNARFFLPDKERTKNTNYWVTKLDITRFQP